MSVKDLKEAFSKPVQRSFKYSLALPSKVKKGEVVVPIIGNKMDIGKMYTDIQEALSESSLDKDSKENILNKLSELKL